jgi:hypothetical protein
VSDFFSYFEKKTTTKKQGMDALFMRRASVRTQLKHSHFVLVIKVTPLIGPQSNLLETYFDHRYA